MERVNQTAVREVTRKIQHTVVSDWEYPLPPALKKKRKLKVKNPSSWRGRYYGPTDDEADYSSGEEAEKPIKDSKDIFAYDNPDEVGTVEGEKADNRKRRRNLRLKKELEENEGLRLYQRRRNEWTGAVSKRTYQKRYVQSIAQVPEIELTHHITPSIDTDGLHNMSIDEKALEHRDRGIESGNADDERLEDHDDILTGFEPCADTDTLVDVMIPLAESIVPSDNLVRSQMTSKSPSDLYDKIVRDMRSPVIPINLAHMTQIIVQGWKDEGNWPPIPAAPEPFIATRRRAQHGVAPSQKAIDAVPDPHGLLANHRHLQKGVNSVKRVFRLSGDKFHSPPSAKALTSKQDD